MDSTFSVLQPKGDKATGITRLRHEAEQNSQAPKAAGSVDTKLLSSANWNNSKADVKLLFNAGAIQMAIGDRKIKVLINVQQILSSCVNLSAKLVIPIHL